MKNKAVVTGATGYIGSHLVKKLLQEDWEVIIIAQPHFGYENLKDVLNQLTIVEYTGNIEELIRFFKSANPTVVFHLASAVLTHLKPTQIPVLLQSNVQFGTEMLEAMRESNCRLFVNTGTYWQNYASDSYNPVDLYAASKEAFEKIIHYYVDAHNYRVVNLRLYDVYGADDKRPKLLNLLRDRAGTDHTLSISKGEQLLNMIHVNDVAAAYLSAYHYLIENATSKNEIFGVYDGNFKSLRTIIELFESILETTFPIDWGGRPYKAREVMQPSTNYLPLPGWKPQYTLEEGLREFKINQS
jgi:CDP-3, 6-dideoxy-D-glycero-L-glycero-4-hexulose-4-reductase